MPTLTKRDIINRIPRRMDGSPITRRLGQIIKMLNSYKYADAELAFIDKEVTLSVEAWNKQKRAWQSIRDAAKYAAMEEAYYDGPNS